MRGASVPAIHHSWCVLVLHEWGQHQARLARVDEQISKRLSSKVPSQKSPPELLSCSLVMTKTQCAKFQHNIMPSLGLVTGAWRPHMSCIDPLLFSLQGAHD